MKTDHLSADREHMVEHQIKARGVRGSRVLSAMRKVPRELFLPERMREFAYEDAPLPIAAGQTISQPYIVAFMIEALALEGGETVLEIGTGSGYAAAVLAEIADEVFTVERIAELARDADKTLQSLDYHNVHVRHSDGTLGWPEQAPFDAIVVAAGGPGVPETLKSQLRIGGRMVIPVGSSATSQELVRITRVSKTEYKSEDIADVRFVPLIGEEGWEDKEEERSGEVAVGARKLPATIPKTDPKLSKLIADNCEPFDFIETADLTPLLNRIGDARVVLLGESSHGTSEFYEMRERITRALVEQNGFNFVAIEGDWPDAARIDNYVRHGVEPPSAWTAFARFPTWMWRNREVKAFVDWLRHHNAERKPEQRVAFYGLDLYSLHRSMHMVLEYLRDVDPETAKIARRRYGHVRRAEFLEQGQPSPQRRAGFVARHELPDGRRSPPPVLQTEVGERVTHHVHGRELREPRDHVRLNLRGLKRQRRDVPEHHGPVVPAFARAFEGAAQHSNPATIGVVVFVDVEVDVEAVLHREREERVQVPVRRARFAVAHVAAVRAEDDAGVRRRVRRVPRRHLRQVRVQRQVEVRHSLQDDPARFVLGSLGVEDVVYPVPHGGVRCVGAVEVGAHGARAVVEARAQREIHPPLDVARLDPARLVGDLARQRVVDAARRVAAPRHRVRFAQVRVRVDERGPQHGAPGVQPARARQGRRVVDGHAGYRAAGEGHVAGHRALRVGGGSQGLVGEARE